LQSRHAGGAHSQGDE